MSVSCVCSPNVSLNRHLAPATFRRKAIGHMATYGENTSSALVYPHRQNTRLRVTLKLTDNDGVKQSFHNRVVLEDESGLRGSLKAVQTEVVEEEIFSVLIREASSLPTASARVSERLIVIEAAHGTELIFELVCGSIFLSAVCANFVGRQQPAASRRRAKRPRIQWFLRSTL